MGEGRDQQWMDLGVARSLMSGRYRFGLSIPCRWTVSRIFMATCLISFRSAWVGSLGWGVSTWSWTCNCSVDPLLNLPDCPQGRGGIVCPQ